MYGRLEPELQANALSCDTHFHTPAHLGRGAPVFDCDTYSWTSIRTDVFDICIDWPQGAHSLKSDVLLKKWYQLYWLFTWSAFFHKWCELQHRERKRWRGIVVVHLLQKCMLSRIKSTSMMKAWRDMAFSSALALRLNQAWMMLEAVLESMLEIRIEPMLQTFAWDCAWTVHSRLHLKYLILRHTTPLVPSSRIFLNISWYSNL